MSLNNIDSQPFYIELEPKSNRVTINSISIDESNNYSILNDIDKETSMINKVYNIMSDEDNNNESYTCLSIYPVLTKFIAVFEILIQLICWIIVQSINPHYFTEKDVNLSIIGVVLITLMLQITIISFLCLQIYKQIMNGKIKLYTAINLTMSSILLFGTIYFLCESSKAECFELNALSFDQEENIKNVLIVGVALNYFSISTFSTVGFGDIVPINVYSQFVACIQMFTAVVFNVFIFTICINHFRANAISHSKQHALTGLFNWLRQFPLFESIRIGIVKYNFVFNILVQIFVYILAVSDAPDALRHENLSLNLVVAVAIEFIQVIVMMLVSWRLVRKISSNKLSLPFLFQSYISQIFSFAGLYMLYYIFNPVTSFSFLADKASKDPPLFKIIPHFVYFSISLTTTVGYGDIVPVSTLGRILASTQMLVAMFYNVIVMGMGACHAISSLDARKAIDEPHQSVASQIQL